MPPSRVSLVQLNLYCPWLRPWHSAIGLIIILSVVGIDSFASAPSKWSALPQAQESLAPRLAQQLKTTRASTPPIAHATGASVLYAQSRIQLEQNLHWQRVQYYSVHIQSAEAARDYGRVTIPFNHYYTDIKIDFARVITATGTQHSVSADAIQKRVTGGGQDFYSDTSEWIFSLPHVSQGSIIEFQYRHASKKISVPGLFSERLTPHLFQKRIAGDTWRADPINNFAFSIIYPSTTKLHYQHYSTFSKSPKEVKKNTRRELHWQMRNLAAIPIEGWMPPTHTLAPQLHISSMRDWNDINRWAWSLIEPNLKPKEVATIVTQFNLPPEASHLDKIKAVYHYLNTNIRYVYAHLGRGGYQPHSPADVVRSGYGDCKDQSVLGIALLNALGIEAYPALVQTPNAGKYDTTLVSMMFDHMLIYIPQYSGKNIWMDTTGERALFPGLSHYLPGSNAMILGPNQGTMTLIPESEISNSAKLSLHYSSNHNQKTEVDLKIVFSGYFEQNLRNWWQDASEKELSLQRFLHSLFNPSLGYEVKGSVHNSHDLWQGLSIDAQYTFNQINTDNPHQAPMFAASFLQIFNLLGTSFSNLQPPGSRIHDYVDPQAYDLEMDILMQGDQYTMPAAIETSDDMVSPYFNLQQNATLKGSDFHINLKYFQPILNVSAENYDEFYSHMTKLREVNSWMISMQTSEEAKQKNALEEIKSRHGESSFHYQKALAQHYIDTGNFELALAPAQAAVKRNQKSGEAWYLLGMAQGFVTLIDESTSSFEQAESLGYFP